MHKHYIQQSVKGTKSSTRNAGGAVFRACPLNTLFSISLWLLHCGDLSCAGAPLDESVPIFTASQQVPGVVSPPFAESSCRSRKTELKRSALGEGWSYQPLFPAPWTAGSSLRCLTEPCCSNKHMVLVETWP